MDPKIAPSENGSENKSTDFRPCLVLCAYVAEQQFRLDICVALLSKCARDFKRKWLFLRASIALESFLIAGWQNEMRPVCQRRFLHTFTKCDRAKIIVGSI
jgi:hypothetical protein